MSPISLRLANERQDACKHLDFEHAGPLEPGVFEPQASRNHRGACSPRVTQRICNYAATLHPVIEAVVDVPMQPERSLRNELGQVAHERGIEQVARVSRVHGVAVRPVVSDDNCASVIRVGKLSPQPGARRLVCGQRVGW
jgi:hypothetical protein